MAEPKELTDFNYILENRQMIYNLMFVLHSKGFITLDEIDMIMDPADHERENDHV